MDELSKIWNNVTPLLMNYNQQQQDELRAILYCELDKYTFKKKCECAELTIFLKAKQVEGLTPRSLKQYEYIISKFIKFIQKPLQTITADDIGYYLAVKQSKDKVTAATMKHVRSMLNVFFSWLSDEGYIQRNVCSSINKVHTPKKKKKAFTETNIAKIEDACSVIGEEITSKDVAVFMLEEVNVPYEINIDKIYVPNEKNCIAGFYIDCCEPDHKIIFALVMQIINLYISKLQEKHEAECRQISAYEMEEKKLKCHLSEIEKKILPIRGNNFLVRGKNENNGKWYIGEFVPYKWKNLKCRINIPHIIYTDNDGNKKTIDVIPETVCSFTGFYDKNNKMIFEGDILENPWIGYRFTVEWDSSCGMWIMQHVNSDYKMNFTVYNKVDFEVIGNIYDNPELITDIQSDISCEKNDRCIFSKQCPWNLNPRPDYLCFEPPYTVYTIKKQLERESNKLIKE